LNNTSADMVRKKNYG